MLLTTSWQAVASIGAGAVLQRSNRTPVSLCYAHTTPTTEVTFSLNSRDMVELPGVANNALYARVSMAGASCTLTIAPTESVTTNHTLEVVAGNVPGQERVHKFGKSASTNTSGAPFDVWGGGGIYTGFPEETETMEVSSSSGLDTAGGTGARTVEISGLLDVTGAMVPAVTVTLNGTDWVSLGAGLYHRGNRMRVKTAGATGENQGVLTLRHTTTTANVFAKMPQFLNGTTIACYTVPLGYDFFMDGLYMALSRTNGSAGSGEVSLLERAASDSVFTPVLAPVMTDALAYSEDHSIFHFDELTDIKAHCLSISDNSTVIAADFDGLLRLK